jgi:hypothetical protein
MTSCLDVTWLTETRKGIGVHEPHGIFLEGHAEVLR